MTYQEQFKLIDEFRQLILSLNVDNTRRCLEIIDLIKEDDEWAHKLEKDLWKAVVKDYAEEGSVIAGLALETQNIKFSRWFA